VSCVLRAAGTAFDVDAFLAATTLPATGVYHRGESYVGSGFQAPISVATGDTWADADAAVAFLHEHEDELRRLGGTEGVESVFLEFVMEVRSAPTQSETLPADLLWRAGALDIDVVVTWRLAATGPAS
jgi:hypothetical protein